ncbi:hypothetical protein [Herbaspirillum sp. YR522]|uniref:hypothetical protein n=1 Tax=Herbaspirillum sp. YR522 TaxID=1144342 RepID=UPI0012F847CC|nr:hypothetical protein [Herbaspirillum sp. YR522]
MLNLQRGDEKKHSRLHEAHVVVIAPGGTDLLRLLLISADALISRILYRRARHDTVEKAASHCFSG